MNMYLYILAMALTTYLIRVLPMTIFRKPIKSRFLRSFLYYVPYCCLTAMTFPSILSSTASILSGAAALVVAVILAYLGSWSTPPPPGICRSPAGAAAHET